MQKLNRISEPKFKAIEKPVVIKAEKTKLSNNIPIYLLNAGTQDVNRIEFVFKSGDSYQKQALVAFMTNGMLDEGTTKFKSIEIAEKLDYYGAFVDFDNARYNSYITLYSLNKHLKHILPILEDLIKNPVFPEKEFNIYKNNRKQQFIVNQSKVESIASQELLNLIFGDKHPYGEKVQLDDYDKVTFNELKEHHNKYYTANNCKILLSGKVNKEHTELLDKHFGGSDWFGNNTKNLNNYEIKQSSTKKKNINKKDAVQTAIRIGKKTINRKHPDFIKLTFVNLVLGGYFGSRLMSNIREDKGYTYGIGSSLSSMFDSGLFHISTEVNNDVVNDALKEIYAEIKRLRTELMTEKELEMVRNYLLGDLLRSLDGPFAMASSLRTLLDYNLGYDYYDNIVKEVNNITVDDVRNCTEKYLHEDSMIEVLAGNTYETEK